MFVINNIATRIAPMYIILDHRRVIIEHFMYKLIVSLVNRETRRKQLIQFNVNTLIRFICDLNDV